MAPKQPYRHRRPRRSAAQLPVVRAEAYGRAEAHGANDRQPMRPGRLAALLVAVLATAVALELQNVLRSAWQIRSLPERVEEWLLLFVPLDLFERGLAALGADAKEVALTGTAIGMGLVLVGIGFWALRAGWDSARLLLLGLGMWLLTMVVIMPVTGAGFFATGLLISPLLTSSGYLCVFLAYATVLAGGRLLARRAP